ncbi:MAG: YlmC/YmxH family sporulation protein, partial [Sulfobacillus sp.]
MRFTELASKEIINLSTGGRLGPLGDTDLVINGETGQIESIIVPARGRLSRQAEETIIPWKAIRRVGPEVLIVDM